MNKRLFILFLILLSENLMSQVTPVNVEINKNSISYHTSLKETYDSLFVNQPYEKIIKIQKEISHNKKLNLDFLESCTDKISFKSIKSTNNILTFTFYTDQTGIIYACSLENYGSRINFSEKEIECVLNNALQKKIKFEFKELPFDFYARLLLKYQNK